MSLTGAQIRRALEERFRPDRDHRLSVSGLRYAYDPSGPPGRRVTALTLPDGDPIVAREGYSVAVNGFLAAGGGDFEAFEEGGDALVAHVGESPQPFSALDPKQSPRVEIHR